MTKGEQIALAFLGVTAVTAIIFGVSKAMAKPTLSGPPTKTDATGTVQYLHPDGKYYPYPPTPTGGDWTGGDTGGGGFGIEDVIGDPCKRWCDLKYMFNKTKRVACKADCVTRG